MPRKIIAIKANTSPTRYVTATHKRFDNKVGVEYTENKNLAMDFGTDGAANETIARIHNPFDRVFTPVAMEVTQPAPIAEYFTDEARLS